MHLNGDAVGRQSPAGDYVAVEVKDERPGMSPEIIERGTEPFFTTKREGKGTGLGLAMASGFVQQSRGRLEIESKRGILRTIGYNEELVLSGPDRPHKDVLGKPYRRAELLDRVRQALNNRAHDQARRTPSEYGAAES